MSTQLPAPWSGIVDDAAIFPPGNAPLAAAVAAYVERRDEWYADLVGSFVVSDLKLPDLLDVLAELDLPPAAERAVGAEPIGPIKPIETTIVISGGAGSVLPAAKWATGSGQLALRGIEIALRDPDDLAGNARRVAAAVDAARAEGVLDDEVPVHVELPHVGATGSWLAAADVVAENDFRLKFRTGGVEQHLFPAPHALASWIAAALDREVAFKCTAGLHNALRHRDDETGFVHHGFLNVLVATRASLDGADVPTVAEVLDQTDASELLAGTDPDALARTGRWFTSFGSCSVLEPLEDLIELGLIELGLIEGRA